MTKRGNSADVRFIIHIWTVRDGKLTHLRQVADSLVVDGLVNG
ncbi:nuclear transport factor 2-like protein [Streptomyces millisiae]|uniref:Integrase n=1 Tax=Streptomyces millisiae TaxID=3075542 RepID=A0ABU2M271_9ACTN|nr:hypothetical protein [Streptomyces sp. DSM 44918]MDT0323955.1 hypothetical protein [Streptomyces sp. DSM 44918]